MTDLLQIGKAAKAASRKLAALTTAQKNAALLAIADEIEANAREILAQNALDIADGAAKGLSEAMLDRLLLNEKRIAGLAADTRKIVELRDPVGAEFDSRVLPNGLRLSKRRIPIGVVGVIYEARPNVTIDIATLCLKTGNATILRGGSETLRSNIALVNVIQAALKRADLPAAAAQYIENPDRALVTQFLKLDQYVDMIVPRGGAGLHRLCREQSTIPVITGGMGVGHIYVDATADVTRAVDIIENSKVQRPSACNALDTLLVNQAVAAELLPNVAECLAKSRVVLKVDERALPILRQAGFGDTATPAGADDFSQ